MPTDTPSPLEMAQRGASLAAEGKVHEARPLFADSMNSPAGAADIDVLFLNFQFHFRIGELDEAERLVRARIARARQLAAPDQSASDDPDVPKEPDSEHLARAYTNLGLIWLFRKHLDNAERYFAKSLSMARRLGHEFGIARAMGNLALVPEERGDLDRAESLFREALGIAERIGSDKLIASKLANLGDIAVRRGQLAQARTLWTRAIALFDRLGDAKNHAEFSGKLASLPRE